eukprot:3935871-Rhodomonas_salina.1
MLPSPALLAKIQKAAEAACVICISHDEGADAPVQLSQESQKTLPPRITGVKRVRVEGEAEPQLPEYQWYFAGTFRLNQQACTALRVRQLDKFAKLKEVGNNMGRGSLPNGFRTLFRAQKFLLTILKCKERMVVNPAKAEGIMHNCIKA